LRALQSAQRRVATEGYGAVQAAAQGQEMKGDATVHTTNEKYRAGYDGIDWSVSAPNLEYWQCSACLRWNHADADHCNSWICHPE
jgi:hypothetical protein